MCKSMMMLIRRLTSVAIRFDAWEETRGNDEGIYGAATKCGAVTG
ncbi:hypothetical protein ECO9340_18383 [Escherichia coli O103:H25 str. CVM9340]|nr:hypothetical protein ECO9340_18383 [Escherichia coli O103:H25 str. CVM9340]